MSTEPKPEKDSETNTQKAHRKMLAIIKDWIESDEHSRDEALTDINEARHSKMLGAVSDRVVWKIEDVIFCDARIYQLTVLHRDLHDTEPFEACIRAWLNTLREMLVVREVGRQGSTSAAHNLVDSVTADAISGLVLSLAESDNPPLLEAARAANGESSGTPKTDHV